MPSSDSSPFAIALYAEGLSIDCVPPLLSSRLSYAKFVALGVAAEIVMVVENKDARFWPRRLAEKVRCRQSTDAGTHDDQIVRLAGILSLARGVPKSSIAKAVRDAIGGIVTSTHSR